MAVVQTLIGNVKGPQGDTGATGPQGAQGEAATIEVGSVSTTAYGNPAQVTNTGTAQEAVFNFVIPQGKPGERTTTMGGLTLDTITTQTADYPVPAVGDTGATAFGKIVKWFSDALTAITGKLDKANVVNNLTTTAGGYALDARQGKILATTMLGTKTFNVSNVSAEARMQTDLTLSGWRVVGFKITQANALDKAYIGANQTLYYKYSSSFTGSTVIITAYYFSNTYLQEL